MNFPIGRVYAKWNSLQVEKWGLLLSGRAVLMNGDFKAPVTSVATMRETTIGEAVFNSWALSTGLLSHAHGSRVSAHFLFIQLKIQLFHFLKKNCIHLPYCFLSSSTSTCTPSFHLHIVPFRIDTSNDGSVRCASHGIVFRWFKLMK